MTEDRKEHSLTFSNDECYCLFLAMTEYVKEYWDFVQGAGELNHVLKCEDVLYRLREWYDEGRRAHGNSESYKREREAYLKAKGV